MFSLSSGYALGWTRVGLMWPFSLQTFFLLGNVPVPGGMRDDLGKEDIAFVTRDGQDR